MQVFLLHTYYHNNYLLTSDFTTGKVKILRNYSWNLNTFETAKDNVNDVIG